MELEVTATTPMKHKKVKCVTIEGEANENNCKHTNVPIIGASPGVKETTTEIETTPAARLRSYSSSSSAVNGPATNAQQPAPVTPSNLASSRHIEKTPGSAAGAGEDTPTSAVKRVPPLTTEEWQAEVKELKMKVRELRTAKLVLARKVNEDQTTLLEFAKKMRSLEELAKLSEECVIEKNKLIEQMKAKLRDADRFSSERVIVDSYRLVARRSSNGSEERFAEFSILVNFVNSSRGSVRLYRRFNELRALDCRVRDAAFGQARGLGFTSSSWCARGDEAMEGPNADDRMIQDAYKQLSRLRFPPTKWFGNLSESFLNKRKGEIQEYLDGLLTIARRAGRSSHVRRVISDWFDLPNAAIENDLLWRDDRIMPLSQFQTYVVASMAGNPNGVA